MSENVSANHAAAIAAIKNKFISTVTKIYINSIGRDVSFREITVAEQKKLSRIMIDNENRKDIIYDAQCAVLQSICLEKDFDIYQLTEFDKIKLLMMLYQRNMMKHDISFTCPECHTVNQYQLNFERAIEQLDAFKVEDVEYKYENSNWKFEFTLAYPAIKTVSEFYASKYSTAKRIQDKKALESINNTINIDYINLFVKKVKYTDKSTNTEDELSLTDYTLAEFFEILSVFPQDVMYSENGIITYITTEFISKINSVFEKHKCYQCGHVCDTSDRDADGFL